MGRGPGRIATVGITPFAAEALGDIVYVEARRGRRDVTAGEPCGEVESHQVRQRHLFARDGEVVEVNEAA